MIFIFGLFKEDVQWQGYIYIETEKILTDLFSVTVFLEFVFEASNIITKQVSVCFVVSLYIFKMVVLSCV